MKGLITRLVILSLIFTINLTAQDAPSLKGKKVLFTYGGWAGHEPIKCLELLKPWMEEEGAKVDTFTNLDIYADEEYMKTIDLVVQIHTMSSITQEQEKGLEAAVKAGAGIAGWHGGLCDAFRQNVEYQFMTGGQWVSHPGGSIEAYNVHITDKEDPITAGISDFTMKNTEQYYMHIDPNVKVLATTTFTGEHADWIAGGTMPLIWKKTYGKGRVFYTSLGHVAKDLEVEEVNTMLKRGIRWASESKYAESENWITPVY